MTDKAKIKSFQFLVERYKKEIEELKANDNFNDTKKVQSVCILREIICDMEAILCQK